VELGEKLGIAMPYTKTIYSCTKPAEADEFGRVIKDEPLGRLTAAVTAMS